MLSLRFEFQNQTIGFPKISFIFHIIFRFTIKRFEGFHQPFVLIGNDIDFVDKIFIRFQL